MKVCTINRGLTNCRVMLSSELSRQESLSKKVSLTETGHRTYDILLVFFIKGDVQFRKSYALSAHSERNHLQHSVGEDESPCSPRFPCRACLRGVHIPCQRHGGTYARSHGKEEYGCRNPLHAAEVAYKGERSCCQSDACNRPVAAL